MKAHQNHAALAPATPKAAEVRSMAIADDRVLYMAFDLGESHWTLAFSDGRRQVRFVTMASRDLDRLKLEIGRAKERFKLSEDCRVVSCYEAGRDGFWLHRFLESIGIENVVVDPASIETNHRNRRAKTDRLDAQKQLFMLMRHHNGEPKVWSVVCVPEVEDEDARQLHRELEQLKKEAQQHRMRISSLLVAQGVSLKVGKSFLQQLKEVRLWDGSELPAQLRGRVEKEYERLCVVERQSRSVEAQRRELLKESKSERIEKVSELQQLKGIGINGAWLLVMEFFGWRVFNNRKEVGAAAGLTGTPYNSGHSEHEQGISKAGNPRVRWMITELAWGWLRFQPESKLSRWYREKYGQGNSRQRRRGIVALARRLLIELWRFVEKGVVPEGAILKVA